MLSQEQIDRIGWQVARAHLPEGTVLGVSSSAEVDWDNENVVRVLFVLRKGGVTEVTGERATKALVDLQDRLQSEGEMSRGTIDYATEEEIALERAQNGGP